MNYSDVRQSLNHVVEILSPIVQQKLIDFDDLQTTISWYKRESGVYDKVYYPVEYQKLVDRHQYSIILNDGSFFQFYYHFNRNILISAKLAYYPVPTGCKSDLDEILDIADTALDKEDEHLFQHLFNWNDLLSIGKHFPINTSHIRFDYDSSVESHEPSHLQFGGVNKLRLPADFYPLPYAFVILVYDLLDGCDIQLSQHISHARNNKLKLSTVNKIISISSI